LLSAGFNIKKFLINNANGELISSEIAHWSDPNHLLPPTSLVLTTAVSTVQLRGSGSAESLTRIIAADIFGGEVLVMNTRFEVIQWISGLVFPHSAVMDQDGRVYISSAATGAITDQNGAVVASGLQGPTSIVVSNGVIYVAEFDGCQITTVRVRDGNKDVLVTGLSSPEGVAIHRDGLVITESRGDRRVLLVPWNRLGRTGSRNIDQLGAEVIDSFLPFERTSELFPLLTSSDFPSATPVANSAGEIYVPTQSPKKILKYSR